MAIAEDHRRVVAELAQGSLLDDADFLREIVERVLKEMLEAEMTEHIGAAPPERTAERKGHRNGHKPRTLRTRVVRIFPNRESCLRLVSALGIEQSEEWLTGRRYLDMEELSEHRRSEERETNGVMLMQR